MMMMVMMIWSRGSFWISRESRRKTHGTQL